MALGESSFQFGGDEEFLRRGVVLDAKDIGLAADLAVFNVALAASGGLVDGRGVPFAAGGALETGLHGREHTSAVKAGVPGCSDGTTEVVPFPKAVRSGVFSSL